MSSRRKGKPQQRKKIEAAVEPDQDFVTCGDCQREFLLSDFVKYIQHKVNRCNKENVEPFEEPEFENEEDPEGVTAVISTQRTSISAPIQQEKLSPRSALPSVSRDGDQPQPEEVEDAIQDKHSLDKKLGNGQLNTRHRVQLVDTGSNTETEPQNFVCSNCKSQFSSPWFLLQHVQNHHGIQIYEEKSPERKPSPSIHSRQNEIGRKDQGLLPEPKEEPSIDRRGSSSTSSSTVVHSNAKISMARSPSTQMSPCGSTSIFPHPTPQFPLPTSRQPMTAAYGSGLPSPFPRPPHLSQDAINRLMSDFNHHPSGPFGNRMPYSLPIDPMIPGFPIHPANEGLSNESVMAIYSRRLRELANPQPNPSSPPLGRKHNVNMFSSREKERRNSETNGSTFSSNTPSKSHSTEDLAKSFLPPKLKQCEYCNKRFRFQSNLIVHRRSHTGQKPYKCPVCQHACTQASKLKRHMKIHTKSLFGIGLSGLSPNKEDSMVSANSTPDKYSKQEDELLSADIEESEEDEEELDEEELEAREREAEQEINILKQQVRRVQLARQGSEKANDIDSSSVKDGDEPTDLSRRSLDSENGHTPVQTPNSKSGAETPTDLSMSRAALINEVMQDSPLVDMPMVKKAYLQAMEESKHGQRGSVSPTSDDLEKKSITENGLQNSPRGSCRSTPSSKQESPSPSHHPMDYSPGREEVGEPVTKRVKSETPERQQPMGRHPSFPTNLDLYHRELYPPPFPWFASRGPQDFMGLPRNETLLPYVHNRFQNGDNLLKPPLDGHKPRMTHGGLHGLPRQVVTSVTSPSGSPPGGIPGVPMRRRNDTCEFCGKIFKNCSNLTVHRRSHTGEKPYKCDLCSYACAQSSKLTRHMKTHGRLGKDVYRCKFCSMPFSVPSTLEKHMRKCVENQQSRPLPSSMTNTDTTGSTSSVSSNVSVSSPVMQSPVESMPGMQSPDDMPEMQSPDSLPVMHS